VIQHSGLIEHHQKDKADRGEARVENLLELVSAARGFDPDGDGSPLQSFLAHAVLESGEGQGTRADDCVQMMTLHTAKGLEFPLVFLSGMEDGLFPHQRSINDLEGLEEERRLCYVGMTRAMRQLYFTYAEQRRLHGVDSHNAPSRFIQELPPDLAKEPDVGPQGEASLKGHLAAWDPVANKEVWRAELGHPWNGGVVSTAGNLVFQGTAMGELIAYSADTGARLWSAQTQAGVLAAPITYEVDGEQYVAIEVGWGGAFGLAAGELALKSHLAANLPRVLAYKLGGKATLPALPVEAPAVLDPPPDRASAATVVAGKKLYHTYCSNCHGDSATGSGVIPDLRYSSVIKDAAAMDVIVRQGSLQANGMVAFKDEVSPQDLDRIRAYVIHRANEDKRRLAESVRNPAAD